MKTLRYKILAYAIISFIIIGESCADFLDVQPTGSLTEEQVFEKIENVEPLVLGLYNSFRGARQGRNGLMPNLGLDESQQGNFQLLSSGDQAGLDKFNGQLNPTSTQVAAIWNNRWPAVTSAAKAVYALGMTTENPEYAKQLLGEASFIRGILMYELSMYWGEIPIIDIARTQELGLGRQPLKDVWEFIINDFQTAANNLPEQYSNEPHRATAGAAWAMLGRAYMSAPEETGLRDFAKAEEAFQQILNKYQLLSKYEDLFKYDNPNSVESIFELQFNNIWPDCNYWQFDTGSRAVDSWFSQGCSFSGYDFLVPTPFAYKTVEDGGIWEDGDTRKEASLRYDFTYYTNRYSSDGSFKYITPDLSKTQWTGTTDELDPHIKKFEDFRTDILSGLGINNMWNSGKNFAVIRYADVILLHAECLNELGQTTQAVTIVNDKIRTRAWGGTLPADKQWSTGMSQQEFRDNILDERLRELCFEGWRRSDLIRTGNFVELVKERNRWANESGTIQEFHIRYPIPDTEIKTNDFFSPEDQNPGYPK
ncbi:MAG: RagB/SusD family nutrient uptake outer membrane protein [Proteiniphilum sp.]